MIRCDDRPIKGQTLLSCSSAPDTSGINAAAVANADVAKEALDWYKTEYAATQPQRDAAAAMNAQVSQADLNSLNTNTAIANDTNAYNVNTFRPLERGIVSEAQNYDTEGNRERLAGLALADVNQSFASARDQNTRALTRQGVNPNDGRAMAMNGILTNQQALAGADAENKARAQATTMGHAMEMDAASLGRNLPSNQATSANVALNAGTGATNAAGMTLAQQNAAAGVMGAGFNTAIQGNQSAGNLYGTAGNIQNGANQASNGIFGALGTAGGLFLGSPTGGKLLGLA